MNEGEGRLLCAGSWWRPLSPRAGARGGGQPGTHLRGSSWRGDGGTYADRFPRDPLPPGGRFEKCALGPAAVGVPKAAERADQRERNPAGLHRKSGDGLLGRLRNALNSPKSSLAIPSPGSSSKGGRVTTGAFGRGITPPLCSRASQGTPETEGHCAKRAVRNTGTE